MTKQEIDKMLENLIEEKVSAGTKLMAKCENMKKMYEEMMAKGWKRQAECFRSIILWTCVLHPDWTERQIAEEFMNRVK